MLALLVSALATTSLLLVVLGLALLAPRGELRERLERYGAAPGERGAARTAEQLELEQPFTQRVLKPMFLAGGRTLGRLVPNTRPSTVRLRLQMAGEPGGLTVEDFVGIKAWVTLILLGLAVLRMFVPPSPTPLLMVALVAMVAIGFRLPDIWLSRRIAQRQKAIIKTLPDTLDMLTIAVEAGLSFDQGLSEIGARWDTEMAREFRRVLAEIRLGSSRREALEHLSTRTGVADLASFVAAVNNAEEMGTSLGRVLDVQSKEMRVRRRQRAQEAANKVPIKMMFPMAFLIFPALLAVILGPAVPLIVRSLGGAELGG